ncbi:hypothetical protein [Psychrobacillus sp.]|uniref:hypothetical protein n=1 Tax=Psychrobacillus sp. TaxID=1871623 RepID=UPI0028BF1BAC|nr:hypothetical protein [Psychrobacillus sp.]
MTALNLQKALKTRTKNALTGMQLDSQEGVLKQVQVFEQHLPRKVKSASRNPEDTYYPCVIIYLDEGENGQVKVLFIIATHDDNSDNQGYRDALSIVEKTIQDLERNPTVDEKFEMIESPKWFYNDQDNHPYYFAWIETSWELPRSMREDVEAMI